MYLRTTSAILVAGSLLYFGQQFAKDYQLNNITSPTPVNETERERLEPGINPHTALESSSAEPHRKILIPGTNYKTYTSQYGPLAPSLRGTSIPAYFETDHHGQLIITPSIKELIEYFLSALGEESIETAIARVEEYFSIHLSEPASSQAIEVLGQYIAYKEALLDLEQLNQDQNQMGLVNRDYLELFQVRRELRINTLSPEVYEAFFAKEDQQDQYTAALLQHKKQNDSSTAPPTSLEQLLPEREQQVKLAERQRQFIDEAKKQGASAEALFSMRSEVYGTEAAERFAAAEAKQAAWDARFSDYRAKRAEIIDSTGLSDLDKQHEIQQLQASMFNPYESKRLRVLDQIADQKSKL